MKTFSLRSIFAAAAVLIGVLELSTPAASAADPYVLADNLGGQLGKAIYCGYDTDEFERRAARALDANTTTANRSDVLARFAAAARITVKTGPIGENCREFKKGFDGTLVVLENAGY